MAIFRRETIKKRQCKLLLTEEAHAKLKAVSLSSGLTMSIIVEVLIKDHCHSDAERPRRKLV